MRRYWKCPELVGSFEKPSYFDYDPDICAHSRSGLKACTRCIDACPTDAITSAGDRGVEIDIHLCQGAGSCATACPTGAIRYAYPRPADNLQRLREMLRAYREAGGKRPLLLFHDAQDGRERVARIAGQLPENVIPVEVEEIGCVGMDLGLAALAYGAYRVVLLGTPKTAASVVREIDAQLTWARALLEAMGYPGEALWFDEVSKDVELIEHLRSESAQISLREPAGFAALDEKRTVIRLALDHLYQQAPASRPLVTLPAGAPFGDVWLARRPMYPVYGLRLPVSGQGTDVRRRDAAAQIRGGQLRAMRNLRARLPGGCHRAFTALPVRFPGQAAHQAAERGRALPLYPLRRAFRHPQRHPADICAPEGQPEPGARRIQALADVRGLPWQGPARSRTIARGGRRAGDAAMSGDASDSASINEPLPVEEGARAHIYRLLGALLAAPPDQEMLALLRTIEAGDGELEQAWRALRGAAQATDSHKFDEEYNELFIGVGGGELTPYASKYLTGFSWSDRWRICAPILAVSVSRAAMTSANPRTTRRPCVKPWRC